MRILVVDDEVRLARHIMSALAQEGHDAVVVHEGEAGLEMAVASEFELIVLDVGLPRLDGFEVLRRLRARKIGTRVLMLTARGELNDRVAGLEMGADDYLAKPFAMQELLARVRALSRRYKEEPALSLQIANLVVNLADQSVFRGPAAIELSSRELTLLKVLMREPGRVFTRTELCERVWEREHEYDMKLVEVFVGRLRKKLGEPALIHTVRHIGYTIREP
jgi:DNA-binding response OmpR family regulator